MAAVETRANDYRVVWREAGIKQRELFATRREAEEFAELVKAHGERWPYGWTPGRGYEQAASHAPTFAAWAVRAIAARSTANDRTRHDYLREVDRHLIPTFGPLPIDRITPEQVGLWLVQISRDGLSPKSIKNVHNLASSIMRDAVEHGLAPSNPFARAMRKLPTVRQEEMVFLTRGEFDTLLTKIPDRFRPLVRLLALSGLRWSEATALRVGDLDVMTRQLQVVRAWKRTPESHFVIGEPKSRRSRRTLKIPPTLLDELLPLVAGRADDEWLFTTRLGHPVRHSNFRQRAWVPAVRGMQRCDTHADAVKPCGCLGTVRKTPRIHDLRHSHASWLISAGVNLQAVQRRMGHESITTTVDRYGHLVPETDDDIVAALEPATRSSAVASLTP